MFRRLATLTTLTLAAATHAAIIAPASAPSTTQPTTQNANPFTPDWSTPKDAYLTYQHGLMTFDGKLIQQCIAWEKPEDGAFVSQLGVNAEATALARQICDQLQNLYPTDADVKKRVEAIRMPLDGMEKGLAQRDIIVRNAAATAEVKIDGDSATLKTKDPADKPTRFKKVDGKWLLLPESVESMFIPTQNATETKQRALMIHMTESRRDLYTAFLKDLNNKKIATGKEAVAVLQNGEQEMTKKLMQEAQSIK